MRTARWLALVVCILALFVVCPWLTSTAYAQAAEEQQADRQTTEEQAAASPAADEAKPASRKTFTDEITVTAQKREEALIEVPISIKAVPADTLETINAQGLADIAHMVPSMSMTNIERGGNNVQIRGLGSNVGNVGTVALYNDGVISATRTQSNGTFAEEDPTMFDVERVEVLRGPQGTLYGEGSFGGVINIISKRPNPQKVEASFTGDFYGIQDGDSSNYDAAAMVNIPLAQDKWALRLVAHDRDRGGYIDGINILPVLYGFPAEVVGTDLNTEKFYGGRVLLGYQSNKVVANLIVKANKTELGISNFSSASMIDLVNQLTGSSFDPDRSQSMFSSTYGSEATAKEGILDINVVTPVGTFTSLSGYGKVDGEGFSDPGSKADNKAYSQEFRLSSATSKPLNYTVGAYYRNAERTIELGHGGGIPFGYTSLDQWSVYGQLYWDISPVVRATLGASYSSFDSEVRDDLNALPAAKNTFDDVSPKVAINWHPDDWTNAYVSAAKGFRAGGANIDESLGTDPNYRQGFGPDSIWNYEIGLKKGFSEGRVALNAAVFYVDWSDIQIDKAITSLVAPPVQFIVLNGDGAHSYGVEADLYLYPGAGWDIVLGGSYAEPEFDGGTIDSIYGTFELKGQTLPSAPRELWNASVSKTFPIGSGGLNGFVRADYSHRGNSYADVPNNPPGTDFSSGSWDLINLRVGVKEKGWEVQLFANNLTNQNASAFDYDAPSQFSSFRALVPPRSVGINLKFFYN